MARGALSCIARHALYFGFDCNISCPLFTCSRHRSRSSLAARVAKGSRVNRIPRQRLADDIQERLDISRLEKNIRPRDAAVQDVIKSLIDDRSCDSWHGKNYTFIKLSRK